MQLLLLLPFLLTPPLLAQVELLNQFQSDIDQFSEQMQSYQESDQATEWQQKHQQQELQKLQEKYKKRKVRSACGVCPTNMFMQKLTQDRLNKLYSERDISKKLRSRLVKGLYYFSFDKKQSFSSFHNYNEFVKKQRVNYELLDSFSPLSMSRKEKSESLEVFIYKTHELMVEVSYNYSHQAEVKIFQLYYELLNSPEVLFKKYNFQDPEFNIPTVLSFQKLVDYNGKLLDFHSDVKVGTGEFLTELDYQLHGLWNGELVFSGTNDNTQTTVRHNLKTGGSSNVSVYLRTYYLDRMTPEQRSEAIVVEGGDSNQNYWGLEWQWVFDSK